MEAHPYGISQHDLDLVEFDEKAIVDWNSEQPGLTIQYGPRLRSEEWRELINSVGQCFLVGTIEFRKALAMYSEQVGFRMSC